MFQRLHELARQSPIVVAHRGNSSEFAENTLPAFLSAKDLGVAMQEFDVRTTRDGQLVCIHDETVDRTTDAGTRLGPGAMVAQLRGAELAQLDAGCWRGDAAGARIPTLAEVLAAVDPAVAMIEHKAGTAVAYLAELRRLGRGSAVLLQSFDWDFVAAVAASAPETALALLGPRHAGERLDAAVIEQAVALRAGMLHWCASEVTSDAVEHVHGAGLMLCTYTTDHEAEAIGLAGLGVEAFCTNRPAAMLRLQQHGRLARR